MSLQTPEQYSEAMHQHGKKPLLHTVIFESSTDPHSPINDQDALLGAIRGLGQVPGVNPDRIIAAGSLTTRNVVEEIALVSATALQGLRTNADHSKVLDVAVPNTNWLVVDRPLPAGYYELPELIAKSGKHSVVRHHVMGIDPATSDSDVADALGRLDSLAQEASNSAIVPAEVARSIDGRKGPVAIMRTVLPDLGSAQAFEGSKLYCATMADLHGIVTRNMVAVHYSK